MQRLRLWIGLTSTAQTPSRRRAVTVLSSFIVAAGLTAGLFHVLRPVSPSVWPEGSAPSDLYLSAYRHDHTDHPLFLFGLFGLKEKIREADILLTGTSHLEFGVDAGQLSALLQAALGRPIKVLNLGRGYGDGAVLTRMILESNDIHDKIIVSDLYDLGILSDYSKLVATWNRVLASWKVLNIRSIYQKDRLLFGILPAISYTDGRLRLDDPSQSFVLRDEQGLDVYNFWSFESGELFRAAHPQADPLPTDQLKHYGPESTLLMGPHWCREHRLRCLFTLIPFPAADLAATAAWAGTRGLPYLDLSAEALTYFDTPPSHLDLAGRELLTRRLAAQLIPQLSADAVTGEGQHSPASFTVSAFGPHETATGQGFSVQPGGASTLWIALARGEPATAPLPVGIVVTWDGRDLPTAFDEKALVLTTTISPDLYATPGHHDLAVVDAESRTDLAHLDFLVR